MITFSIHPCCAPAFDSACLTALRWHHKSKLLAERDHGSALPKLWPRRHNATVLRGFVGMVRPKVTHQRGPVDDCLGWRREPRPRTRFVHLSDPLPSGTMIANYTHTPERKYVTPVECSGHCLAQQSIPILHCPKYQHSLFAI